MYHLSRGGVDLVTHGYTLGITFDGVILWHRVNPYLQNRQRSVSS